jgi:UDP-glucose 4-epimerase
VTGGLGFIGSALVDKLTQSGHNVFVIDDLSTGLMDNRNKTATYIVEDLAHLKEVPKDIDNLLIKNNIEAVFHLAASADVNLSMRFPEKVFDINLMASVALLNACRRTGVKKFAFASTSAVYGEPKYLPVDEAHELTPISTYGLTKLNFEQYMLYCSAHSSIDMTVFRLPNVYGPRQRMDLEGGVIAIFKGLLKTSQPLTIYGDGEQTRDWVHVSDIVTAFASVLSFQQKYEIINLGAGSGTSLNQLIRTITMDFDNDPKIVRKEPRKGDIKHMVLDASKAKRLLGWEPSITFDQGVYQLIREN